MALQSNFDINVELPEAPRQCPGQAVAPCPRRVAMLVTHGMGQQVPYETLSAIGQALIAQHSRGHSSGTPICPVVEVRRVTLTSQKDAPELSRAEVRLKGSDCNPVDVHVYESYWAPLTEGQISFLQTVGFLYSAGWNGIKTFFSRGYDSSRGWYFDRWLFGDFREMRIKNGTLLMLLICVLSVSLLLIPALLVFTPVGLAACKKIFEIYKDSFFTWNLHVQIPVVCGAVLIAWLGYWIHYFIVEYVGDVAIYVSSYKVSRFERIRNSILDAVCTVIRQIYSAGIVDTHQLPYDKVVIVGHSLGSVISYDALNYAINWDQVECGFKYKVVDRTTRLITFGSPLDKTAFLFRSQVTSGRNLREALAALKQPLIVSYLRFRPKSFRWINIHSPMDIISGSLKYYDWPPQANSYQLVDNKIDWQAWIPLVAHTQYWNNRRLHEELLAAVNT